MQASRGYHRESLPPDDRRRKGQRIMFLLVAIKTSSPHKAQAQRGVFRSLSPGAYCQGMGEQEAVKSSRTIKHKLPVAMSYSDDLGHHGMQLHGEPMSGISLFTCPRLGCQGPKLRNREPPDSLSRCPFSNSHFKPTTSHNAPHDTCSRDSHLAFTIHNPISSYHHSWAQLLPPRPLFSSPLPSLLWLDLRSPTAHRPQD
jgi:hypothetical protein